MVIKETSIFTCRIQQILDDEAYRLLQLHLVHRPDSGNLIPASGGIRKIRWAPTASGKRGGARIIYYWAVDADTILMLSHSPRTNERILVESSCATWPSS